MPEVAWEPGLTEMPRVGSWVRALEGDGVLVEAGMVGAVVSQRRNPGRWDDVFPVVKWADQHQCVYPLHLLAPVVKPRLPWLYEHASCGQSWSRPRPEDDPGDRFPWLRSDSQDLRVAASAP